MFRFFILTCFSFTLAFCQPCFANEPCNGFTMPRSIGDLTLSDRGELPLMMENGDGLTIAQRLANEGIVLHCAELYFYRSVADPLGTVVQAGRYTLRDPSQPSLLQQMIAADSFSTVTIGGMTVYIRDLDPAGHPGFQAAVAALESFSAAEDRKADIMEVILARYAPYKLDATWEMGNSIYSVLANDEETIRQIVMAIACRPVS